MNGKGRRLLHLPKALLQKIQSTPRHLTGWLEIFDTGALLTLYGKTGWPEVDRMAVVNSELGDRDAL